MTPPTAITILSDSNILELKETIKTKDGLSYKYEYTKSIEKLGKEIVFSESELTKLININT